MRTIDPTTLDRGEVCLDEGPNYTAWIARHTWNGWRCPYLAEPEVRKLQAVLAEEKIRREAMGIVENTVLEYHADTRTWIESCPGDETSEPIVYEPVEIDGIVHWPIGYCSWCWWLVDET